MAEASAVISGVMPKSRRYYHRFASGLVCFLLAGIGVLAVRLLFQPAHRSEGLLIATLLYLAVAALGIATQVWFQRRIIGEFHFDSASFRFRALASSTTETRALSEIADVREWRGRGRALGYMLVFRDGGKAYLQHCVSNAPAVAEQLRSYAAGDPLS